MHTTMHYENWGITVATRLNANDYAPVYTKHFGYPVGPRGPVEDWQTEHLAIDYCRSVGGEVKGPFFRKR